MCSQALPPRPGGRPPGAWVVAALAAVFWGYFWFGLIDLLVVIEQDERFRQHHLSESGWDCSTPSWLEIPLVVLAMRPGDPIALAAVATLAVLVGALLGCRVAAAVERARPCVQGGTG